MREEIKLAEDWNIVEEYWQATTQLRWIDKSLGYHVEKNGNAIAATEKVLQQLWQGNSGSQEWKDIPYLSITEHNH